MLVYGGQQGPLTSFVNTGNFKDAWLFDMKRCQWRSYSTTGTTLPYSGNQFGSCAVLDKKSNLVVHVFGNTVFTLDVNDKKWIQTETRAEKDILLSLASPEPMMLGLTAVSTDSGIIVFCGVEHNQDLIETKVWYLTFILNLSVWILAPLPTENPPPDQGLSYTFSSQVGNGLFIGVLHPVANNPWTVFANRIAKYVYNYLFDNRKQLISVPHQGQWSKKELINYYDYSIASLIISMLIREVEIKLRFDSSHGIPAFTMWELDFQTNTWWQYSSSDPASCFTYSASTSWKGTDLLTYSSKFYQAGRHSEELSSVDSAVCIYDVKRRRWLQSEHVMISPKTRFFPSLVDTGNGSVVLFGGYACFRADHFRTMYNFVATLISMATSKQEVDLSYNAFLKLVSSCSMLDDMWILNLSKGESSITAHWTQIFPNSTALPSGRILHTMLAVGSKLFLAGGITNLKTGIETMSPCDLELWYFDLASRWWYRIRPRDGDGMTFSLAHPFHMCRVKATALGRKIIAILPSVNANASATVYPYQSHMNSVLSLFLDSNKGTWVKQTDEGPFPVENLYAWKEQVFAVGSVGTFSDEYSYAILPIESLAKRTLTAMRPGCHPGWYSSSWSEKPCSQCKIGTFSLAGSTACSSCPDGLTTSETGAPNRSSCVCQKDYCGKYGVCFVSSNSGQLAAECQCDFGYTGDQCQYPTYYIITCVSIAVIFIVSCLFVFLQRMLNYRRMKRAREMELEEMGRVWTIDSSELLLIERIDRETPGSYGNIYRARYRDMIVAVKKLKMVMRRGRVEQEFEREILLMRSIRHPNIVLFIGAGRFSNGNCPFLVLEFMQGGALTGILHDLSVQLNETQQIRFCLDAAKGMEFLHSLQPPRIHRDMKSSNLLVSEHWVVKVADFGSARLVKSQGTRQVMAQRRQASIHEEDASTPLLWAHSDLSRNVGAVLWRAPEIFLGESYGTSADLYSFGIVMWEIVFRQIPYEDRGYQWIQEVEDAVLSGTRPTLRHGYAEEAYVSLMQKCWASEPENRPPFQEIVNCLQQMLQQGMKEIMSTDTRDHVEI
jgi:hypothetical protein